MVEQKAHWFGACEDEEEMLHTPENGYVCGNPDCPCSWIDSSEYTYTLAINAYARPMSHYDFEKEAW